MKRRYQYITAAVIGIAVFFCLTLCIFSCKGTDTAANIHAGSFPQNAQELFSMKQSSFYDTYQRFTGNTLDTGCLRSETAADFQTRAVWFSYTDWEEQLSAKTQDVFIEQANAVCSYCISLGLDTIILQLRAFGDAFYPSEVYPQSKYCAAKDFDPLAVFLSVAEGYQLNVEGWVNPFRLDNAQRMAALEQDSLLCRLYSAQDSPMLQAENGIYWLDPADARSLELILAGLKELSGYGLKTIWFDDYFYSGVSPVSFGTTEQEARKALNQLIKQVHQLLEKQNISFGISPQGNITGDLIPLSDQKLYTSLALWCEKGWVDRLMPQIYYGFSHETADFETICARWEKLLAESQVTFEAALAAYKCGKEDIYAGTGASEWIAHTNILSRQIQFLCGQANGFSLFRYGSLSNAKEECDALKAVLR